MSATLTWRAFLARFPTRPDPEYDWKPTSEPPPSYFREIKVVAPPVWTPPTDDLSSARAHLKEIIEDYLMQPFPTYRLLIKALPGTGKTTASVAALDALYTHRLHRRTLYAGPRHDFFQDLQAITLYPQAWYEWQPRRLSESEEKPETCRYQPQITAYMNKGFQAQDFCQGVCGFDYMSHTCPWHRQQAQKEPVIFGQHQHVVFGHPLEFNVLLGDESPLHVFKREWRIPTRWILPPGMDPTDPLTELLHGLTYYAERAGKKPLLGEQLLEFLGGPAEVVAACEPHVETFKNMPSDLFTAGGIGRADDVEQVPYAHLIETVPLLYREASQALAGKKYPHRIILGGDHMTLLLRQKLDKNKLPPWMIWLDATARPDLYEQVFEVPFQVVDASPKMLGTIFQVTNRTNGKSALVNRETKTRTAKADETLTLIKHLCEKHQYQRPALISYKDALLELDWIETGHFYAARGTNAFEHADAIFILGAPMPQPMQLVNMAKMLFFERDEAFRVVWSEKDVPYEYVDPEDGQGRAYPVSGFWGDPDLQAVLEMFREDELIQAVHRIRPVNHPCDIWLFTNIPVSGLAPDRLVSMQELQGAPEGTVISKWNRLLAWADGRDQISLSDLPGAIDVHYETAKKYFDALLETGEWQPVTAVRTGTRGRPKRTIERAFFADFDLIN